MESLWLAHAKRLQAIASTGLHFARDPFDRERYAEVAQIANAMLAELGSVPIARIEGLVSDFAQGYATPKVDVRGAVIEDGRVLLVRERSDGRWTLPGGFADVGLSAAQNIAKEMREEAGIEVAVAGLYAVRHKAKRPYEPDARDFYKLFFLCERESDAVAVAGHETSGADFFAPDALPELSLGRVTEADIAAAFAYRGAALPVTLFD
ncbi:NUDIX hydrolase [Sphingosinicella sp. CPCC 101087]|uniref:NUDIX hydrolase n=1 Tax=Sphingosinicella sp. CPCC 101087 TaxID=2497754 RepID=UPI00101D3969|nr:NUDIX hydrolase [Sphingosinicella sp. CPCC 101087]